MEISFEEFQKLDLRIGKIIEANQIPGSRNLIKMIVEFGDEKRQAVAAKIKALMRDIMVDPSLEDCRMDAISFKSQSFDSLDGKLVQ